MQDWYNIYIVQHRRPERVRREVQRLLKAGVSGRVFPGASVSIMWREPDQVTDVRVVSGVLGQGGSFVSEDVSYDLDGLSRISSTVLALRLVAAGDLSLDTEVGKVLPDLHEGPGAEATIRELLTHRSGLAPWGGLYLDVPHERGSPAARRWMLTEAARRKAERAQRLESLVPGELGYLILGEALSRYTEGSIDVGLAEHVTGPLGIASELNYFASWPLSKRARRIRKTAPTERCQWRGKVSHGDVFDENCAAMGGAAGHAGLFGTASALGRLGIALLDCLSGTSDFLPKSLLEEVLSEESASPYRMGFRMKREGDGDLGRRLSVGSFGGMSKTGPVMVCDPRRNVVLVMLSNRVHPTRANEKIHTFLPAFLDGVLAAWDYRRPVSLQPPSALQPTHL